MIWALLLLGYCCVENSVATIVCPAPADYEPCVCVDSGDGLTIELQCRNLNLTDVLASAILDAFIVPTVSPLSRLDMSLNALTKVPDQIASSLHQLVYVNLPNNQIQSLPSGALNFDSTSAMLDVVFLNNNQMTSIASGAFQGDGYGEGSVVRLYSNELTRFEAGVFQSVLEKMAPFGYPKAFVDVFNNPFDCVSDHCHMAWIIRDNRDLLPALRYGKCANGTEFERLDPNGYSDCIVNK